MGPSLTSEGEFDTFLEEVLHLITFTGYYHAYPSVFGPKNSLTTKLPRGKHKLLKGLKIEFY